MNTRPGAGRIPRRALHVRIFCLHFTELPFEPLLALARASARQFGAWRALRPFRSKFRFVLNYFRRKASPNASGLHLLALTRIIR